MTRKKLLPILLIIAVLLWIFRITIIRGDSMNPTYINGQVVLTTRIPAVKHSSVVVVEHEGKLLIKRVVGMPGDFIEVRDNTVFINGEEEEVHFYTPEDWLEVTLSSDEYFLLGDNREYAADSRTFGVVHKSQIRGVVIG